MGRTGRRRSSHEHAATVPGLAPQAMPVQAAAMHAAAFVIIICEEGAALELGEALVRAAALVPLALVPLALVERAVCGSDGAVTGQLQWYCAVWSAWSDSCSSSLLPAGPQPAPTPATSSARSTTTSGR